MSYFWTPEALGDIMAGLAGDVATALETLSPAGRPTRVLAAPGTDVAWDNCQCGQLSIGWTGAVRSRVFPNAATDAYTPCDDFMMAFALAATLVRCVGIADDDGNPPAPATVTGDLVTQVADAQIVWTTIDCALRQLQETNLIAAYVMNDQAPVGPLGGCSGTLTNFKIGLIPPCPCDPVA